MGSQTRLNTRPDGACVFLDDKGLCKIHAKFGEPTKPLACRIYPYAFHPAGDEVVLSLRFSCPSVIANRGQTMEGQIGDLRTLQKLVVPAGADKILPPVIAGTQRLTWEETLAMTQGLVQLLADTSAPIAIRLLRAQFVTRLLGQANFDKIRGERVEELVQILTQNSASEVPQSLSEIPEPDALAKTQFRLIVAQYARKDKFSKETQGTGYRLKMLMAGLKMTRGKGQTPAMQPLLPSVSFADIDAPMELRDEPKIDELWTRYFIVKLEGLNFTGKAFYDLPYVEGLQRLWMMFPITQYLAKWIARGKGQSFVNHQDLGEALAIADHHHGFSPALAMANFRSRAKWLIKNGAVVKLLKWSMEPTIHQRLSQTNQTDHS